MKWRTDDTPTGWRFTAPSRPLSRSHGGTLDLSTSSYSRYRPEWGRAIRTTVGRCRWFAHPAVHAGSVTPYGLLHIEDPAEFAAAYVARLDRHGSAVIDELQALTGGAPAVLLCFERDPADCHRSTLAGWLADRFGLDVPEHDPPPPSLGL